MKAKFPLVLVSLLLVGAAPVAFAQTPNIWSTRIRAAPDGCVLSSRRSADMPTPVEGASTAVVKGILIRNGRLHDRRTVQLLRRSVGLGSSDTNMVSESRDAHGSARCRSSGGGGHHLTSSVGIQHDVERAATVESYDPATDTWTEEAPLLVGKSEPTVGLVGTTIVAADGLTDTGDNSNNESYDVSTNTSNFPYFRSQRTERGLRRGRSVPDYTSPAVLLTALRPAVDRIFYAVNQRLEKVSPYAPGRFVPGFRGV